MGNKRDWRKYTPRYVLTNILVHLGALEADEREIALQRYYEKLNYQESAEVLRECFQSATEEKLDLEKPITFNQKIQWMKMFDSTPIKTRLADKYLVRPWVSQTIGEKHLIPLAGGPWYSEKDIDFDALPEKFVLKANHSSGMNIIVTDKSKIDVEKTRKECGKWLRKNYGLRADMELHYRDIKPCIIAEEYMENLAGDLPDYKCYCFNSEPRYIQVIVNRKDGGQMAFYDLDWNDAGFSHIHFKAMEQKIPKPRQLDKVIKLARKLSDGFAFVRVDFYLLGDEDIFFGEMTFTPASGIRHWVPEGTNEMLGEMITLPEKYDFWMNR